MFSGTSLMKLITDCDDIETKESIGILNVLKRRIFRNTKLYVNNIVVKQSKNVISKRDGGFVYFGNDVTSNTAVVGDYTRLVHRTFTFRLPVSYDGADEETDKTVQALDCYGSGSVVRVGEIHGVILVQKKGILYMVGRVNRNKFIWIIPPDLGLGNKTMQYKTDQISKNSILIYYKGKLFTLNTNEGTSTQPSSSSNLLFLSTLTLSDVTPLKKNYFILKKKWANEVDSDGGFIP
ncbi:hypothetical protein AGLY_011214 [Aphis glycines]|uniref:Uncharacterized protein n=1 Tax=Aphis glycines TaxID=307491 RepID=A0A6G0TD78_APHGL|nr:hypothetical protein AGLY_011214 [Aphis glycines]